MTPIGRYKLDVQWLRRPRWTAGVRTALWVAVVTVLIWVYADMRFTDHRTLTATLRLVAPAASQMALIAANDAIVDAVDTRVQFKVEGSREQLDRFEREYQDSVLWDVTRDYTPGQHTVNVREALSADPQIAERGLRVISAEPASVPFRLDSLVHQTVPVELGVSGADLAEPPSAPPVGVTVPQGLWDQIVAKGPAVLKTKEVDLSGRPTGPVEVTFEIFPEIAGVPVRLDQNTVKATLDIRQRTAKKNLVITVRVLVLPDWDDLRNYELVRKDALEWRPEITVSGPKTDLDKLDAKDVEAYIVLREDDRKPMETWAARAVTIRFPPNLQVQLDRAPPQVNFRLDKRPAESASP
ncbi:MAG: hypothetical protein MUP47_10470 [Phycisphaerae bacterium]|nr:hypothetical protein [Phycisphaerae bacterium]